MAGAGNWLIPLAPAFVFAIVAIAELTLPRRALRFGRMSRWLTSLSLLVASRATIWLLGWIIAVPIAANWATANDFGLFNQTALPLWVEILAAFILLDFAMWLQHWLTHKVPILWRMHKVHHSDPDMDASTGFRFHPFEIAVSVIWKAGWVVLLGVSLPIMLAFEAWLAANAAFNHGNIELPRWLDRWLRTLLVTPDMHLVHHSTAINEQQSNYGFALTVWDRLFGTYCAESKMSRDRQTIGLAEMQDARPTRALFAVKLPLT